MRYVRGFLMAWGNFSAVPCPYKKWHQQDRTAMLCMLPLVGSLLGVIVACLWAVLDYFDVPGLMTGVLLTAVYFFLTGFIHLDGFMDCSDAIMSRRPELSERQRILKDSHTGAFAVIAFVMMLMVFTSSMIILTAEFTLLRALMLITVIALSRAIAVDAVINKPAMKTSQYVDLMEKEHAPAGGTPEENESGAQVEGKTEVQVDIHADVSDGQIDDRVRNAERTRKGRMTPKECAVLTIVSVWPMIVALFTDFFNQDAGGTSHLYLWEVAFFFVPVFLVIGAAWFTGYRDRKQLGGMNGDISGHMIVTGETVALLVAALLASGLPIK